MYLNMASNKLQGKQISLSGVHLYKFNLNKHPPRSQH